MKIKKLATMLTLCLFLPTALWAAGVVLGDDHAQRPSFGVYLTKMKRHGYPPHLCEFTIPECPSLEGEAGEGLRRTLGEKRYPKVVVFFDASGSTSFHARKAAASPVTATATDHIALSQIRSAAIILGHYLPNTNCAGTDLYLCAFANKPYLPFSGVPFPMRIQGPESYRAIAASLPDIFPYPGGNTYLSPALDAFMGTSTPDGDTLFVLVTDGHVHDPEPTANKLAAMSKGLSGNKHSLHMLIIGAGSIAVAGSTVRDREGGRLSGADLCTMTLSGVLRTPHRSLADCNAAYLGALLDFSSISMGAARYASVYGNNYDEVCEVARGLFSGADDGSYALYVQDNQSGWFHYPHPFHEAALRRYLSGSTPDTPFFFRAEDVELVIEKIHHELGGILKVTNSGSRHVRALLYERRSSLRVTMGRRADDRPTGRVRLSSRDPRVQARIDWILQHPPQLGDVTYGSVAHPCVAPAVPERREPTLLSVTTLPGSAGSPPAVDMGGLMATQRIQLPAPADVAAPASSSPAPDGSSASRA